MAFLGAIVVKWTPHANLRNGCFSFAQHKTPLIVIQDESNLISEMYILNIY